MIFATQNKSDGEVVHTVQLSQNELNDILLSLLIGLFQRGVVKSGPAKLMAVMTIESIRRASLEEQEEVVNKVASIGTSDGKNAGDIVFLSQLLSTLKK